jgi:hypothetical protein
MRFLHDEIARIEAAIAELEKALAGSAGDERAQLLSQIEQLAADLARLRRQLASISLDSGG